VFAVSPAQDVQGANTIVERALAAARSGDVNAARQSYSEYENTWFDIEDGIRSTSRDSYVAIEKDMSSVTAALAATPPDQAQVIDALTALDAEQQRFIAGAAQSTSSGQTSQSTTGTTPTVATLLDQLNTAQAALARGDYPAATAQLTTFETTWLDVEGEIKTRSADDYRTTETDMALAASLAAQRSPEAAAVVDRMATRLETYRTAQQYGVFDASIILLREGLEALLVIGALSAVLKKSGSRAGQGWLWAGAVGGLAASVVLGLAIQAFFSSIINPANRELLEGVIGLFAAAMLIYVSYWLHSKASIGGWQSYINAQTRDALKGGRLIGIAVLAFLAVFREGAETALFYLGMVSNISGSDMAMGLAIGFGLLLILGLLMVVVGVRIPMRPFFAVASVLVFYLCFKFLGTGIHALQVSGYLPSGSSGYLPSLDLVGLYPTWPTTIAQVLLLALAAWVLLRDRVSRPLRAAVLIGVGALLAVGAACSMTLPVTTPGMPAVATGKSTAATGWVVPPAPVLTSTRPESTLVAGPRTDLERAGTALAANDIVGAREAMDAYDADWNGIEVYVNFRSRDLYADIESHYESDIVSALDGTNPDASQILPMLQAMLGRYDEAIHLSDTGAPLSPLFDDLATLRTVRAPLRNVSAALKAGDATKANTGLAEFKWRWPRAQPLLAKYAPDALQQTTDAMAQLDAQPLAPGGIDRLLTSYNAGINVVNDAARQAGYQSQQSETQDGDVTAAWR
jgi:high-affinity iron transporter